MTSAENTARSTFTKYEFADDDFNGPMNDSEGRVAYILSSPWTRQTGTTSTTVYRPNGETVGSIEWPRVRCPQKVTLNGVESKDLLYNKPTSWFKVPQHAWKDEQGNELYWKSTSCYTSNDQIMAEYVPEANHILSKREPAMLLIDPDYAHALDRILFTALLTETGRQRKKRVTTESPTYGWQAGVGLTDLAAQRHTARRAGGS